MNRRQFHACLSALAAAGLFAVESTAEDQPAEEENLNLATPTLGGMQFWADELFFHDWHIQRNCFTGHYRLLDGKNVRHAWGTVEQCERRLTEIRAEQKLPAMSGRAVVALHGLMRSASSMSKISQFLAERGGYTVFNVTYASTRGKVGDHAASLAKVINRLDGIDEINFVAHSLGNLVIRHYLADAMLADGAEPKIDPRWKRMVMLGAPNNGAAIAEALLNNPAGRTFVGASGNQLAREWQALSTHLATPPFEFGVVAGGRNAEQGYNPLLKGDNDLVVTVESTRLPGATDFIVLPVMHSLMMNDAKVDECTLRFFQHGHFVTSEARRPIAKPQA